MSSVSNPVSAGNGSLMLEEALAAAECVAGQLAHDGERYAQIGREPGDFVGQALRIAGAGGQYRDQAAFVALVGALRDQQGVGGAGKWRDLSAFAGFD